MGARENKVEKYLHEEVEKLGAGFSTRKWVSPGRDGVPDRIVFTPRFIAFVEVKTLDGVTSEAQHREQERLRSYGANVRTVAGHAGVDEFIDEICKTYYIERN